MKIVRLLLNTRANFLEYSTKRCGHFASGNTTITNYIKKYLFNVNKFGVVLIITNFKTVCVVRSDMGVSLKLSCIHWTWIWMGSRPSSTIEVESRTVRLNIQGVFLPTKKRTKALWKLFICILHHLMEMPKNVWILPGGGGRYDSREEEIWWKTIRAIEYKGPHTKWGRTIYLTWMVEPGSLLLSDRESLTMPFSGYIWLHPKLGNGTNTTMFSYQDCHPCIVFFNIINDDCDAFFIS